MPCVWAIFPQVIYHSVSRVSIHTSHLRLSSFLLYIDESMSSPETVTVGQIILAFARMYVQYLFGVVTTIANHEAQKFCSKLLLHCRIRSNHFIHP